MAAFSVLVLALLVAGGALWLSWRRLASVSPARRLTLVGLRALALGCLAAMLLDPVARRTAAVESPARLVLLVDRSASMSLRDAPQGLSRFAWQSAALRPAGPIGAVVARGDVRSYSFDRQVRAERLPLGGEANGAATDLDAALRAAMQAHPGHLPDAVVVVSDGAANRGPSREQIAAWLAPRRVPVYCLGVGSTRRPPDAWLARVEAPRVVRSGATCRVVVTVASRELAGRVARLSLSAEGLPSAERQVAIGGGQRPVEFSLRPTRPGLYRLQVALAPIPGEWSADNNRRTLYLRVTPGEPKLLLVGGSPSPEFKFVRRALESHRQWRLTSLVRKTASGFVEASAGRGGGRLPAERALREYDAILLQDLPTAALTASELPTLRDFVADRGGGLGVLGGPDSFGPGGYAAGPLTAALGVRLDSGAPYSSVPVKATPAADGGDLPPIEDVERHEDFPGWPAMPLLGGLNGIAGTRAGASVLLRTEEGRPLLVVQRYGSGRTLCLLTGGTHRWVLSRDATEASGRGHAAFWRVLAGWLAAPPNRTPVALETDRDVYEVGQTARVVVQVTDEGFRPLPSAHVVVKAKGAEGSREIPLSETPGTAGRYEGGLPLVGPGAVRLTATARLSASSGEPIGTDSREIAVEPSQLELSDPVQDAAFLRALADATGGAYLAASEAHRLAEVLKPTPRREVVAAHTAWARSPWVLVALLAVLACDWLLRRWWA